MACGLLTIAITCPGCHLLAERVPVAQIRAVIPKQLLVKRPVDKVAEARFERVVNLAKSLSPQDALALAENCANLKAVASGYRRHHKVTKADQRALVEKIWRSHPDLESKLGEVLLSGPLSDPRDFQEVMSDMSPAIDLVRTLVFSADSYASYRDFGRSRDLLVLALRLVDELFADRGTLTA